MIVSRLRSRDLLGRRRKAGDKGFTLVELLVVITILGILAAVVIAAVSGIGDKGEESAKKTDAGIQQTAQEAFYSQQNRYEDPLILQRDGFLSSQSGYNDVAIDRTSSISGVDGGSFSVWTPKKTEYPVTIRGCHGTSTTYNAKPAKPMTLTPEMHELFYWLELDTNAKIGRVNNVYAWPDDKKAGILANLEKNASRTNGASGSHPSLAAPDIPDSAFIPADSANPDGSLPARHIFTRSYLNSQAIGDNVDFFAGSGTGLFSNDAALGAFRSGYTEQDLISDAAAGGKTIKTYSGFAVGGCNDVLDKNGAGEGVARTSMEATFADIRNIGIIFDVQDKAAEVISMIRGKVAESLQKAGPGKGMRVALSSVYLGRVVYYGGNHGITGLINLAGGKNPFDDQFPVGGRAMTTKEALVQANPEILMIVAFTGNPTTKVADCEAGKAVFRSDPVLSLMAAVKNDRFVCANHDQGFLQGVYSYDLVSRLADELARGPAYRGPAALP